MSKFDLSKRIWALPQRSYKDFYVNDLVGQQQKNLISFTFYGVLFIQTILYLDLIHLGGEYTLRFWVYWGQSSLAHYINKEELIFIGWILATFWSLILALIFALKTRLFCNNELSRSMFKSKLNVPMFWSYVITICASSFLSMLFIFLSIIFIAQVPYSIGINDYVTTYVLQSLALSYFMMCPAINSFNIFCILTSSK